MDGKTIRQTVSRIGYTIILLVISLSVFAQSRQEKLIRSIISAEMSRHREAWHLDYSKAPKWNYTQGLELKAMMDYADQQDDEGYRTMIYKYAQGYADTLIGQDGVIRRYKLADFKLDNINSGKILFRLYQFNPKPQYKVAMDTLRLQLALQPRTPDGGFWHKQIYPEQMWLDGLYMSAPYYAEYAQLYENGEKQAMSMDDVEHQFCTMYNHAYCPECKLLHHAWDADMKQSWANKTTGRSEHAWGRAEGWYLMALVDYLDIHQRKRSHYFAQDQGVTDSLVYILESLCSRMLELQDKKTGAWMQVLDCPDKSDNYLEMSVTPMMAYVYLKGVRLGLLDKTYYKAGIKALDGIEKHFTYVDDEGRINLREVCKVAGLSDTRNGSYEYYIGEAKMENDPKGLGPWIMALTEELRIKRNR